MSGSGYSNAGDRRVYEAGDQRQVSNKDLDERNRTHNINVPAAQSVDPNQKKTELANSITEQDQKGSGEFTETAKAQRDPTAPARDHGNEPSRGARIDKELQEDDEAILKKKGDAMPGKKY